MSPFEIRILLWHYASPAEYAGPEKPGAVAECLGSLERNGLMKYGPVPAVSNYAPHGYMMTEKGKAYVEMLCATPFPVAVWIHPNEAAKLAANR